MDEVGLIAREYNVPTLLLSTLIKCKYEVKTDRHALTKLRFKYEDSSSVTAASLALFIRRNFPNMGYTTNHEELCAEVSQANIKDADIIFRELNLAFYQDLKLIRKVYINDLRFPIESIEVCEKSLYIKTWHKCESGKGKINLSDTSIFVNDVEITFYRFVVKEESVYIYL